MTRHEYRVMWFLAMLAKLPDFDGSWPLDVCLKWWDCWDTLWRWACVLTVEDAIERYQ